MNLAVGDDISTAGDGFAATLIAAYGGTTILDLGIAVNGIDIAGDALGTTSTAVLIEPGTTSGGLMSSLSSIEVMHKILGLS